MSAQHTAGPWMAAAGPSSVVGWPVVARGGRSICNVSWLGHRPAHVTDEQWTAFYVETQANANLIAASPALLEALLAEEDLSQRGMLNMTDAEVARIPILRRKAISLATGESK